MASSSSDALPPTKLRKVTLYKNELAFIERTASLDAGASLTEGKQRGFCLKVPHGQRELTVETISATTSNGSSDVIVSYASGGEGSKARQAAEDSEFKFDFGKGVGLGAFLASVVGSDISVVRPDGSPVEGLLMNVSDERRAVKGSEHETEAVWSELHVLTEAGSVERVRIDETQTVRMMDAELHAKLVASLRASLKARRTQPPPSGEETLRLVAPAGGGGGGMRVSYAQPTKEWMCKYNLEIPAPRLAHDAQPTTGAGSSAEAAAPSTTPPVGRPSAAPSTSAVRLHLFGEVSNSSGEDWDDVQLSLVANELPLNTGDPRNPPCLP